VKKTYQKLLEADIAIKTGKYDGDLALDLLVVELGQG
jgi:DNA polymerase III delta subunit